MMKLLNLANTLFEGAVGLVLLVAPALLLLNTDPFTVSLGYTFAIAALTMALISALLLREKNPAAMRLGILVLVVFHTGETIIQTIGYLEGFTPLPVAVIHAAFALSYGYVYRARL